MGTPEYKSVIYAAAVLILFILALGVLSQLFGCGPHAPWRWFIT